jgi:molybdopterin-guanine dinucleotide biosynthesis protein A
MFFILLLLPPACGQPSARNILLILSRKKTLSPIHLASLSGFVLAGGASKRMGSPKAELLIEGQTMIERQIRLLRSVARSVSIVGHVPGHTMDFDFAWVPDVVAGCGPLAGIYTALLKTRTEFNLVLGCDLPFINQRLLAYLALRAIAGGNDVVVPRSWDGRLEPLCAVYRRRALYAIRASLAAGERRLRTFFPRVSCAVIPWKDLAQEGFGPSIFDNMNSPQDYEYARKRLEASKAMFA